MIAPRVKICGVTRLEDAAIAVELGASAIGLVFWPGSPRFIDPARAGDIAARLPEDVETVGVFVDQAPDYVASVADLVPLAAVQLHGSERLQEFRGLRPRIIKAIAVTPEFDMAEAASVPSDVTVLLDAHDPVKRGGTGRTIDWTVAAAVAATRRTVLSGGLNTANVADAIAQVRPYMIDVSSGVESSPGHKDAGKMRALFASLAPYSR